MQQRFLLQILLLPQHVSGTTMPIIRSSRVLYSGCCLWYFVLWFFKLLVWCGAEGCVSGLQDAGFHILTTIHGQNHIKFVFRHICRFTASSDVRFFCFINFPTSISHFILGLPFLPPPHSVTRPVNL